tara:strand:- start:3616 stop:4137 length:522 start_codon:yes stop_codon:yes gene_type:complete
MIKLKTLLSEKFLGFGFGAGKVKEQQLPDASATDIMQGLDRDPATGQLNNKQQEVRLDQLKFDDLVKIFRVKDYFNDIHFNRMQPDGKEGPYYRDGLSFPNPNDTSSTVADMKSLENWKERTKRRFGNIKIILDPDAEEHWEKVKIEDDKFSQDKKDSDQAKMDTLKSWGTTS